MQVRVAIQSTGSLLTAFPFFAKEEQLLKRVALLLRPMYALAGEHWSQCFFMMESFWRLTCRVKLVTLQGQ